MPGPKFKPGDIVIKVKGSFAPYRMIVTETGPGPLFRLMGLLLAPDVIIRPNPRFSLNEGLKKYDRMGTTQEDYELDADQTLTDEEKTALVLIRLQG